MPALAEATDRPNRVDGRTARGAERKERIARAVIGVIAEHGIEGLTHRRVAAEAEVPLGSTTYYFATLDDLLVAGLADAADRNIAAVRAWASNTPDGASLVDRLVAFVQLLTGPHRAEYMAAYEVYLAAIRRPALRPIARRWDAELVALFAPFTARRIEARVLVYALDGIVIDALMQDMPPTPEQIRPLCRALVKGLGTTL